MLFFRLYNLWASSDCSSVHSLYDLTVSDISERYLTLPGGIIKIFSGSSSFAITDDENFVPLFSLIPLYFIPEVGDSG